MDTTMLGTRGEGLPSDARVVLDRRVSVWRGGRLLLGGAPWRLVRLAAPAGDFIARLRTAGAVGLALRSSADRAAADLLVGYGMVHPIAVPRPSGTRVAVVIPAFGRLDLLSACLAALGGTRSGRDVVVVDDASPDETAMAAVVDGWGCRRIRHDVNRGPGAARNTGLEATSAPIVAFLDSDCTATPDWLDALVPLFDDPRVGAVAPRVRPRQPADSSLLTRYEQARSALDMGPDPALVRPASVLGFVPSAALLVRRDAVAVEPFDAAMRLGEDVDLVWRLADAGWHVRYEPSVTVLHSGRVRPVEWLRRRFEYGTSAADLDRRHPGRLAPVRPSAWNLATTALLLAGRPAAAAAVGVLAAALLARRLRRVAAGVGLVAVLVGKGLVADAVAIGHALRREWWPVGWAALCSCGSRRLGRAASAAMLAPLLLEWSKSDREVEPALFVLLRLAEDTAYGSGVLVSAVRQRRPGALLPIIRWPGPSRQSGGSAPATARRQRS